MSHAPAFMIALEATVPGLRSTPSPVGRALWALRAEQARRKAIHEYRRLLTLEDHLLADIGLSRDEVRSALRAEQAR
jgi:uncharacterized protein YjiS (DUF1127 family)